VLIRDFLTPDEVQHMIQQATDFERSEVVAEQKQHYARTSSGSWLNGAKRDDKVGCSGAGSAYSGGGDAARQAAPEQCCSFKSSRPQPHISRWACMSCPVHMDQWLGD
jgi:hypothetical protein